MLLLVCNAVTAMQLLGVTVSGHKSDHFNGYYRLKSVRDERPKAENDILHYGEALAREYPSSTQGYEYDKSWNTLRGKLKGAIYFEGEGTAKGSLILRVKAKAHTSFFTQKYQSMWVMWSPTKYGIYWSDVKNLNPEQRSWPPTKFEYEDRLNRQHHFIKRPGRVSL